jgi:hypothetical protein
MCGGALRARRGAIEVAQGAGEKALDPYSPDPRQTPPGLRRERDGRELVGRDGDVGAAGLDDDVLEARRSRDRPGATLVVGAAPSDIRRPVGPSPSPGPRRNSRKPEPR